MAESFQRSSLTHTNDDPLDSERPQKRVRVDDDEITDEEDEEPVRQTAEIKASDLYLDTASAVVALEFEPMLTF
jgi:hypothetical protein